MCFHLFPLSLRISQPISAIYGSLCNPISLRSATSASARLLSRRTSTRNHARGTVQIAAKSAHIIMLIMDSFSAKTGLPSDFVPKNLWWLYLESQTLLQVALAKRLNPQSGFRGGIASNMPNGVGSPSPVYLQSMAKLQRAVPLLGRKPRMLLALAQCIGNLATTIATIELPPGTEAEDWGRWMSVAKHGKTIQKAVVSGWIFNFVGSNRIPYSATTIYTYMWIEHPFYICT